MGHQSKLKKLKHQQNNKVVQNCKTNVS